MRNTVRKIIEKEINEYEGNYLSSFLLGYVKSMGLNGRLTKIEIFEIIEEYLISSDLIDNKNQTCSKIESDPVDKEKIKALEKEIKELNETIEKLKNEIAKKNKLLLDQNKLKNENRKLNNDIEEFENNYERQKEAIERLNKKIESLEKIATPGKSSHNARGAGRKPIITDKQIAMIQMLRAQGKTLSDISRSMGISYGNVQKYSKL